ncbi:hypothetical protein C5167_036912 [Papaver somniferum]|uniref:Zinc knuckle CX2CX4HX4C domain-containing protein n=1 Tax=Papaver somniferum TaxID=3469 RepID=A0A4Y7I812_PAPSO|nr:hypothetical protein C5167_036912 [Papaver somniferum]
MEAVLKRNPWTISTDPPNCRPTYGSMISARVKIDLRKPLFRGGWWNTRAGGVTWVRYHWERQPHNLCPHCWTIDHNQEECATVAHDLKVRRYTNEEYINYIHDLSTSYNVEICEDMDLLIQRICEASKQQLAAQEDGHEEPRRTKRSRSTEDEDAESIEYSENNESTTHNKQNSAKNPSCTEFDGMEHDLIEEGENTAKESPQLMDEAAAAPKDLGYW